MAAFKTDESFLEKIAIGAIGTRQVFEDLQRQEHRPIELERGSMSYKIWKTIKIKRIRVPDILCARCGTRIESRAKTKLEITMSHSLSDQTRGWDAGLKDTDYVALVNCAKIGERPIDWQARNLIQYISVKHLREAEQCERVLLVEPKGAQEGFERRITWPSAVASADGTIKRITADRVQFSRASDNRTISLQPTKKGVLMKPLVTVGKLIQQGQILASVVPIVQEVPCNSVGEEFFLTNLSSSDLSERYAAAKALSLFHSQQVQECLVERLTDADEHIYVKLEAAASLARFENAAGYTFLEECLKDNYLQNVLETVIVLAEIKTDTACEMLCSVLADQNHNPEIRAGAAWGLGELSHSKALSALTHSFESAHENIKIEAARALRKLTRAFTPEIIETFQQATTIQRPGLAWALSEAEPLHLDDLLNCLSDEDSRHWVAYILGVQGEEKYIEEIEKLKDTDPEVYFATTVLWKIMTSWIYGLQEYA